jgi:alpha-tubulin suppressor-like RCC1 family protein
MNSEHSSSRKMRRSATIRVAIASSLMIAIVAPLAGTASLGALVSDRQAVVSASAVAATVSSGSAPASSMPSVDPDLDAQLTDAPTTMVLIRLRTEFSGSDAQRSESAQRAVASLLSTLPAGSYADVADSGVLPIAMFRASRAAVDVLRNSPLVQSVGIDRAMHIASDNARFRDGSATANAIGSKGDGSIVAVIDSGVQANHPYLMSKGSSKVVGEACFTTGANQVGQGSTPSVNFVSPCPGGVAMSTSAAAVPGSAGPCPFASSPYNDTTKGCDHGTHVAGVVAGEPGTSGFGALSGVAPNSRILAIQVFGFLYLNGARQGVTANSMDTIKALQWLYNRRADYPGLSAVNVSIATADISKKSDNCDTRDATMKAAIDQLRSVGIVTIASAGNSGWDDGVGSPACISTAVGIGAIDDATGARASFSNIGTSVDLLAPGAGIYSSYPGLPSTPMIESGTSQATPTVAGAWALMRQKYPNSGTNPKSVTEILELLRSSGTNVSTTVGNGSNRVTYNVPRLNIGAALGAPPPTKIAIGGNFSCARDTDGTVSCSGGNESGQLGVDPTSVASATTPRRIAGLAGVTDVAAGDAFACAVAQGAVKCWGSNASMQLGDGNPSGPASRFTPTAVKQQMTKMLTGVSSISAAGSSVCATKDAGVSGTVRCWGSNASGQLGAKSTNGSFITVPVMANANTDLTGVKSADVGSSSSCAVMNSGAVKCWGANSTGALGNNTTTASQYPVQVVGIDGVAAKATAVQVGDGFACALLTTGKLKCWGQNTNGQLGNNTSTRSLTPVNVVTTSETANSSATTTPTPLTGAVSISLGANHACAVANVSGTAKAFCWGLNSERQLGVGTANRWFAAAVFSTKTDGAISIASGPASSLVVVTNAAVGFGRNSAGQLGVGTKAQLNSATWSLRF